MNEPGSVDSRYAGCKTGRDIQVRIILLAHQEARDLERERKRYDEWMLERFRAGLVPPWQHWRQFE